MNITKRKTISDPMFMEQDHFVNLIEKLFEQEHEYTEITKEQFIENYLVIVKSYIQGKGYNPLDEAIKGFMQLAVDNVLGAEKNKGEHEYAKH